MIEKAMFAIKLVPTEMETTTDYELLDVLVRISATEK